MPRDCPKHLPWPNGPYVVGCTDVMLDYDVNGLFLRLYYPVSHESQNCKKWIPWLQDTHYMEGMARVLKVPSLFLRIGFWWADNIHIPVLYGTSPRTEEKLKCVIMTHGMGGSRFFYSKTCYDIASHGYLVISPEHRDSCASYTYYYANKEDAKRDKRTEIQFHHHPFGNNHYKKRREQLTIRSNEIAKLINFLRRLNDGIVPHNVLEEMSTHKPTEFKLDDLVGNLDVEKFTIIGHSFGGSSALQVTAEREDIECCVLLDPWMYPLKDEGLHEIIKIPLLFINTQTFHIQANVKAMEKFLTHEHTKMFTLRGTTHEHQADSVLMFGSWLNLFLRKNDPKLGFEINNSLIIDFLHERLNKPGEKEKVKEFLKDNAAWFTEGLTKAWA